MNRIQGVDVCWRVATPLSVGLIYMSVNPLLGGARLLGTALINQAGRRATVADTGPCARHPC